MPSIIKNPNINILKEPRGFIKIIEIVSIGLILLEFGADKRSTVNENFYYEISSFIQKVVIFNRSANITIYFPASPSFFEYSFLFNTQITIDWGWLCISYKYLELVQYSFWRHGYCPNYKYESYILNISVISNS